MSARKKSKKYPPKKHIRNLAIIILATFIDCAGYIIFIKPNDVLAGGLWGIAAIINHFFDAIPMGVYVAALNIPLLIWGWNKLSLRFALYTIFALSLIHILDLKNSHTVSERGGQTASSEVTSHKLWTV